MHTNIGVALKPNFLSFLHVVEWRFWKGYYEILDDFHEILYIISGGFKRMLFFLWEGGYIFNLLEPGDAWGGVGDIAPPPDFWQALQQKL